MSRELVDLLRQAESITETGGRKIAYPSSAAAQHVRNVMRELIDALKAARPNSHGDYVERPKDYPFSSEEADARKRWALDFIPKFAGVARGFGYGVFSGGSLVRDIDLVAVPWLDPLPHKTPDLFVVDVCVTLALQMGNRGVTVHGHRWYALWDQAHRDHQIDLKVIMPGART